MWDRRSKDWPAHGKLPPVGAAWRLPLSVATSRFCCRGGLGVGRSCLLSLHLKHGPLGGAALEWRGKQGRLLLKDVLAALRLVSGCTQFTAREKQKIVCDTEIILFVPPQFTVQDVKVAMGGSRVGCAVQGDAESVRCLVSRHTSDHCTGGAGLSLRGAFVV